MVDFNIQYGLSTEIFIDGKLNKDLIIDEGCWYLCTDTAELFLGTYDIDENGQRFLTLKLINETTKDFITDAELAAYGFITEQALSEYVKKSELPSHEGLATEDYVTNAIKAIPGADLTNYYDKTEVDSLINGIEHPTIPTKVSELSNDANYATEQYVIDAIANQVPVESLAKKEEIQEVKTKLETEVLPTVQETIIPVVQKVEEQIVPVVEEIAPVVKELAEKAATQEWVKEQTYLQAKYEVLPIDGMFIQYRDGEIRLNTQRVVPVKQNVGASGNPNMFYATFRAFAPEGATQCKEGLNGKIDTEYSQLATDKNGRKYTTIWAALASFNGTSWSKWGDTSTLDKYLGFYYHFEWYNGDTLIGTDKVRVILTNDSCHDDLVPDAVARRIDEKVAAVESQIPVLDNYATKQDVTDAIANIDIPEVSLENYYTKAETDAEIDTAVSVKADAIPFDTDKFVNKSIGKLTVGYNVKGLSIVEILAKLLELTDENPVEIPDEPDIPEEFASVAEKIEVTKLPMYSVTDSGEVVTVPFKLIDSTAEPTESGFYTVKDSEGSITEAGYQDISIDNDEMYYAIALPKEIDYNTMVDLYTWDPDEKVWVDSELALTSDPGEVARLCDESGIDVSGIDTDSYTVWVLEDLCTGSIIRYKFKKEVL